MFIDILAKIYYLSTSRIGKKEIKFENSNYWVGITSSTYNKYTYTWLRKYSFYRQYLRFSRLENIITEN